MIWLSYLIFMIGLKFEEMKLVIGYLKKELV